MKHCYATEQVFFWKRFGAIFHISFTFRFTFRFGIIQCNFVLQRCHPNIGFCAITHSGSNKQSLTRGIPFSVLLSGDFNEDQPQNSLVRISVCNQVSDENLVGAKRTAPTAISRTFSACRERTLKTVTFLNKEVRLLKLHFS